MASFHYNGYRITYTEHGSGDEVTVLLPGLLLPQTMQFPLARQLARRGHRVITMDPLGHGTSDRPTELWHYSMAEFARQTIALLDHLELDRAVVGGTSLGANITLEVASQAPDRLQGMIIEMPVLDNAIPACGAAFTPLLIALKYATPLVDAFAATVRRIPRSPFPFLLQVGLDWVSQDAEPSASVLGGILYGRVAPGHQERCTFQAPTLIIGHPNDPVHPFSDAGMLASELPNGRLLHASSILELRLKPKRLTREIAAFVDDCWTAPAPRQARPVRSGSGTGARRAPRAAAG
ncbi:MAG TPA: alpha/beta fold hydrolase [Solirubrobacteraceae bacterium]|nr:alpha/beta fold hydrolase [Solirubrobacteraceae bacterium]